VIWLLHARKCKETSAEFCLCRYVHVLSGMLPCWRAPGDAQKSHADPVSVVQLVSWLTSFGLTH
jgi:hypothetical protein